LMSFFVLLLCQGSQKTSTDEDLLRILASVKVGFGYTPRPDSKDPLDIAVLQVLSHKYRGGFQQSGQRWLSPSIKGRQDKDRDNWVKAQSSVGKPIRFARDSASIPKTASENLEQIAEVVRHHFRTIVIQGHCSQEEARHDSLEGDDLALRRAIAVKTALKNLGVGSSRLRIVSCSSNEPLKNLKSPDRQLVVVTIGAYFLPTDNDVLDEGSMPKEVAENPTKQGGH
jgi:outer membrane protein OmpA-like peptidoglycan-associated protein